MTNGHSIIACSSAGIWGPEEGCPGYVTALAMYPELEASEDSKEGSTAHDCAFMVLSCGDPHDCAHYVGIRTTSHGMRITAEMAEAAQVYVDDVAKVTASGFPKEGDYGFELKGGASDRIHALSFGTPDAWIFDRATGHLYVWDFKFGFGWVSEYRNWQLTNYVALILQTLGIGPSTERHITVHMRIVQPRAYGPGGAVREWVVPSTELRPMWAQLQRAAKEALGPNPTYRSGAHCKDCPARSRGCDAAWRGGAMLYEAATNTMPRPSTPQEVGIQLNIVDRAINQMEAMQSGLQAMAEHYMGTGLQVPGRTRKAITSHRKWTIPAEEVAALGAKQGKDLMEPAKAISPAKAEKLGIDTATISEYCTTYTTGAKVVPDKTNDHKRLFKR